MKKSIQHVTVLGLMVLFLFSFLAAPVSAQEKKVIKVAFPELTGFSTTDEKGNHSGYNYEFLQEVAKYTGWEYEFITGEGTDKSLLEMMDKLEKGEIDLMGGMIYSDELAKTYDFPEYSSGNRYTTLSVLKSNQSVNEANYSTFNNMSVGIRENAKGSEKALDDFAKANGFTINKKKYASTEALKEALEKGEVDALLGSDVTLSNNERIIARFNGKPYYFAVTKGNTEVVSGINAATAAIIAEDPNYTTNLYMKYFDKNDHKITLHSYIQANPTESVIGALVMGLVIALVVSLVFYIHYQRKQQLLLDLERYRIISEISKELIFEYDYKNDQLVVSEEQSNYFTPKGETEHFLLRLESMKAKGDSSAGEFMKLLEGRPPEQAKLEMEFEGNLLDEKKVWVRGISVIIYDKHKQPLKAVGKIYSIEDEKKERDVLINQATRDALTGLYNRVSFEKKVMEYIDNRGSQEGMMLVIDLDRFKEVNDTLGHQGGDEVLQDLANEMTALFSKDDVLGRLGGDEFLAFVKDYRNRQPAIEEKVQNLCGIMNRGYFRNGRKIEVSISVGMSPTKADCCFEALYFEADQALYYIKQHGRNSFKLYDEAVKKEMEIQGIKELKGVF